MSNGYDFLVGLIITQMKGMTNFFFFFFTFILNKMKPNLKKTKKIYQTSIKTSSSIQFMSSRNKFHVLVELNYIFNGLKLIFLRDRKLKKRLHSQILLKQF
jgi:hypothetical protein